MFRFRNRKAWSLPIHDRLEPSMPVRRQLSNSISARRLLSLGGQILSLTLVISSFSVGRLYCQDSPQGQKQPAEKKKQSGTSATSDSPGHIFWVVPAFKVDYAKNFKPLTVKEKFDEWARGSYDPLGLGAGAVEAATLNIHPKTVSAATEAVGPGTENASAHWNWTAMFPALPVILRWHRSGIRTLAISLWEKGPSVSAFGMPFPVYSLPTTTRAKRCSIRPR